jgi:hypothetical protein
MDVTITKLQQSVAVICVGCRKSIAMTPEFVEAIRALVVRPELLIPQVRRMRRRIIAG